MLHQTDFRQRLDAEQRVSDPGTGHPLPGTPRWDAQFGRGWVWGLVVSGLGFLAGGVCAVASGDAVGRVRGLAVMMASLAGGFLFAALYVRRYGIGFGWQSEVIWPDEKPLSYLLITGTMAVLAATVVAAAIGSIVYAETLAPYLR